jgi:uncharacterized membrane protein YeiH
LSVAKAVAVSRSNSCPSEICVHASGMGVGVLVGVTVGIGVEVDVASVAAFVGSLTEVGGGVEQA